MSDQWLQKDDDTTLSNDFVWRIHGSILVPGNRDTTQFFESIVQTVKTVFRAVLVTLWDNNPYSQCLVKIADYPPVKSSRRVLRQFSLTGKAIVECDIVETPDLREKTKIEGGIFQFPEYILQNFPVEQMVSIPIPSPYNQQNIRLVLNIYYGSEGIPPRFKARPEIEWLTRALGIGLDYLLFRVHEDIRAKVAVETATASGLSALFQAILPELKRRTHCTEATLFRWDSEAQELHVEISNSSRTQPVRRQHDATRSDPNDVWLIPVCIDAREPGLLNAGDEIDMLDGRKEKNPYPSMAVPIWDGQENMFGVLYCRNTEDVETGFSSIDIGLLENFAQALATPMERFLRQRERPSFMRVVQAVTAAAIQANLLEEMLQYTVRAAARELDVEVSSIFLVEQDSEGTRHLILKATEGWKVDMKNKAKYDIGEGLTGAIAMGKILNFKSYEEAKNYKPQDEPQFAGKYDAEVWGGEDGHCRTFLGLPLMVGTNVIGVWKMTNLKPSLRHPEPYFTDEDIQIAQILSSVLAYAIENYQAQEGWLRTFNQLATSSLDIEAAKTEDDAILTAMAAVEKSELGNAMFSRYDPQTGYIDGLFHSGDRYAKIVDLTHRHIDSNDILAISLRENKAYYIPDSRTDARCDKKAVNAGKIVSQYIIPLRFGEEYIGTLQVDMGERSSILEIEELLLRTFAAHLAVSISNIRNIEKSVDLANQVLPSSRFLVAETLSGMVVHSLKHKIEDILNRLESDLKQKSIRDNRLLLETLERWQERLTAGQNDLKAALEMVRGGANVLPSTIHLHPQIQKAIGLWIGFINQHNCKVRREFNAENDLCEISEHAFREILSVLLVNAVQAHAREIVLRTYTSRNFRDPRGNLFKNAFCLECEDNGEGLKTQNPEEIFQANYSTKSEKHGSGLGLFIARRLAGQAGGNLTVQPKPSQNKGVTFLCVLPLNTKEKE